MDTDWSSLSLFFLIMMILAHISVVGLMDRALDLKPEANGRLWVRNPAPTGSPRLLPGRCTVGCPLLQVCTLGWVKCREHISLLIILCIIVYVTNKAHPSLICIVVFVFNKNPPIHYLNKLILHKTNNFFFFVHCWPSGKYVNLLYMYSILGRGSFCFNYCLNSAWHGGDQFVALLRWYGRSGFFDSGLQLICIFWSLVSHFPLDNTP